MNKYLSDHGLAYEGKYHKGPSDTAPKLHAPPIAEYLKYRQNDNISHFICRLAYCRNEELRRWFLTQEARLFNLRLQGTDPQKIKEIITRHFGLNYKSVDEQDPEWQSPALRENICFNLKADDKKSVKPSDFIKVPFKEALSLVSTRQVFLMKGVAYVPV